MIESAWLAGDVQAADEQIRVLLERHERSGRSADPRASCCATWPGPAGRSRSSTAARQSGRPASRATGSEAADDWRKIGNPYEQALELGRRPDGRDASRRWTCSTRSARSRRPAGAGPPAGARCAAHPSGSAAATRRNPAGLTDRQVDVLALLATGLTNAEIAERLVVSTRTVDHHVSAILTRLDVASRRDAARRAAELGLAGEIGSSISV